MRAPPTLGRGELGSLKTHTTAWQATAIRGASSLGTNLQRVNGKQLNRPCAPKRGLSPARGAAAELVDSVLFEELSLADVQALSDLSADQIEALSPSQLRLVIDLAKEVNRDFFALLRRLEAAGQRLLGEMSEGLSAPLAV